MKHNNLSYSGFACSLLSALLLFAFFSCNLNNGTLAPEELTVSEGLIKPMGTPVLPFVLDRAGEIDLIYTILFQETYPSWYYITAKQ